MKCVGSLRLTMDFSQLKIDQKSLSRGGEEYVLARVNDLIRPTLESTLPPGMEISSSPTNFKTKETCPIERSDLQSLSTQDALKKLSEVWDKKVKHIQSVFEEFTKSTNEQQEAEKILKAKIQQANAFMDQLIAEEKQNSKNFVEGKNSSQIGRKKKKKVKNSNASIKGFISSKKEGAPVTKSSSVANKSSLGEIDRAISLQEEILAKFTLNLWKGPSNVFQEARIERWKIKELGKIRFFQDKDQEGNFIFRYKDLDDEAILEQRARHFLPGTERLLRDPYRSIYTFSTNRGYGAIGQLTHHHQLHDGVLYFGIDKTHKIFHKYFENANFKQLSPNVFEDRAQVFDSEDKIERDPQWQVQSDFRVEVSDKGVVSFFYSDDHQITLFPLNKDLFNKALSKKVFSTS